MSGTVVICGQVGQVQGDAESIVFQVSSDAVDENEVHPFVLFEETRGRFPRALTASGALVEVTYHPPVDGKYMVPLGGIENIKEWRPPWRRGG